MRGSPGVAGNPGARAGWPLIATAWVVTPAQAYPARISCADGAPRSNPAVTFSQLTITTPLNCAGSAGRATYIRVRYPARSPGRTAHWPSRPMAVPGTGTYDW